MVLEHLPIDGDLKGYLSGRSTRTFQTPSSYGAEKQRHQDSVLANLKLFYQNVRRGWRCLAHTSWWAVKLHHKLVQSAEDGDLMLAFNAVGFVKETTQNDQNC